MSFRSFALWTIISTGALVASASAQSPAREVKYNVSCKTCRVEFTLLATVGKRSDPAEISTLGGIVRDSRGRMYTLSDNYQILAFDSRGNFLKALGRRGEGPGEFDSRVPANFAPFAHLVVGRGDSLFVFNPPKVVVFSPALEYVRTIATPAFPTLAGVYGLSDGSWLLSAAIRTPESIGRSLHIMSPDGTIRRSLGPEQVITEDQRLLKLLMFRVSPDRKTIWFPPLAANSPVSWWSIERNVQLGSWVLKDVPFLPTPRPSTRQLPQGRSMQTVGGGGSIGMSGIDTLGQLWLVGRPPVSAAPSTSIAIAPAILLIVDPFTGAIKSRQDVPAPVSLFPAGDFAWSGKREEDGFSTMSVWSYRFVK